MSKKPLFVQISSSLALLFFFVFVLFPLWKMFSLLIQTDVAEILLASSFIKACKSTLLVAFLVTFITVLTAMLEAWLLRRIAIPGKTIWRIALMLPMLVPSVSLGNGLVTLLGKNGFITNALHLPMSIYGLHGVVLGQVIYCLPPAFLLIDNIIRYEDYTSQEAAIVLGVPSPARFMGLTIPYLRHTLISTALLVFTMSVTDYGIPFSLGGKMKTLSTMMYSEVAGQLKFGKGSVIGLCLFIPAVVSFAADTLWHSAKTNTAVTPFPEKKTDRSKMIGTILCIIPVLLTALPILSFIFMMVMDDYPLRMTFTLSHLTSVFRGNAGRGLKNSLMISAGVALLGTFLSSFIAYSAARTTSLIGRILHLFAVILQAVPGLVLGLAFILAFKKSFLYGTFGILILVNTVHFFTIPYTMLFQRFGKLNANLEPIGAVLGIKPFRLYLDVFVPQCKETLFEMLSYFFVNSMVTISAVSFLATASTRPLSMLIMQYSDQMNPEDAAAFSFIILVINLIVETVSGRYTPENKL